MFENTPNLSKKFYTTKEGIKYNIFKGKAEVDNFMSTIQDKYTVLREVVVPMTDYECHLVYFKELVSVGA